MFLELSRKIDELPNPMGNKSKCTLVRRGTIVFEIQAGLGMNLLSVSQLQNKGYDVFFIGKKVYVKHPSWKKKAQIGVRSNRLYKLQLESPMALIGSSGEKYLNELWHRRMGNLRHGTLIILKRTVTGVPELSKKQDDVCRGCALDKYAKAAYSKSNNRDKSALGLIHLDICGPMSTKSLSGAEYFVTFNDDHSRKTWIYFLRTKDEVSDRFKEFKSLVENLTGKRIKVLRLDNGGEYIDKDFTNFCAEEGIRREWTTPYNPEQNGVAKKKNNC